MIQSGSLKPGIDPHAFGLPEGTALRYEVPDPALRPFFPSYAVLDSDISVFKGPSSWALPGWSQIWIVLTEGPISVQVRNRKYAPLGGAVLYGPTSRAMPITSNGGISIVVDVSPLGWARWFDTSAEMLRDRITPLEQLWPQERVEALIGTLHASNRSTEVKAAFDDFFLSCLPPEAAVEQRVARAAALLASADHNGSAEIAAELGFGTQTLLRLSNRYFGYGPKLLMRRTRFLRALCAMLMADALPDPTDIPVGYHDMPHFLRDSDQFLGLTPRRFLSMPMPYLRAALRARSLVIGAPMPLLDQLP
jgi:methylphosphotriester-DNA--protein-cysteine methyltransferase